MTDQPCLEVPFYEVEKWEKIQGSCARFYAAAKWGYKQALATPPPLAPNYIDPEHHGEDRELLQVFYAACNAEGGTADEIHLRGIRAVMAACTALATPPPKPPTVMEIIELSTVIDDAGLGIVEFARAALHRWGYG